MVVLVARLRTGNRVDPQVLQKHRLILLLAFSKTCINMQMCAAQLASARQGTVDGDRQGLFLCQSETKRNRKNKRKHARKHAHIPTQNTMDTHAYRTFFCRGNFNLAADQHNVARDARVNQVPHKLAFQGSRNPALNGKQ